MNACATLANDLLFGALAPTGLSVVLLVLLLLAVWSHLFLALVVVLLLAETIAKR